MTLSAGKSSYNNLSLCVYIGNTSGLDEASLFGYCAHFGAVISSPVEKKKFCDFHIIEFANDNQLEKFLSENIHEVNRILLEVKLYKNILTNNDILNIDRKFFIGPIISPNDVHMIAEFYRKTDPTLRYCVLKQDKQLYVMFELNNRQYVTKIFEKQLIPITHESQYLSIHKPVHPKQYINELISMKNKHNQVYVYGLTENITEPMLIEYFNKRAPVIACKILLHDPKFAIIEFNDKRTVKNILDLPSIRLQGVNLSITKATLHLASILSHSNDNDDSADDRDYKDVTATIVSTSTVPKSFIEPSIVQNSINVLLSTHQENTHQQFVTPALSPVITDSTFTSASVNDESGWSSPPRAVLSHCPSLDQLPTPLISTTITTTHNDFDNMSQLNIIDIDTKPVRQISSINTSRFAEFFQSELDQIRSEYGLKFEEDRISIDREINQLIREERQTFEKFKRYLIDHRRNIENRNNSTKRKHSPSSSRH